MNSKCWNGECARHLNEKIGEHISTSPLTKNQVKPKNSSVAHHLQDIITTRFNEI